MDPTDARRLVRELAAQESVSPDAVLGRSGTQAVVRVRRMAIRQLLCAGMAARAVGRVFGRSHSTILEIARPWRPRPRVAVRPAAPAP